MTASESMRDSLAFCGDAKDDATHYVAVIAGVAEVLREQRARLAAIAGESSASTADELAQESHLASSNARRARIQAMGTSAVSDINVYRNALTEAGHAVQAGRTELAGPVRCLDHALKETEMLTDGYNALHGVLDQALQAGQEALG